VDDKTTIKGIDDVKCPICGNPVNWKHFTHWCGFTACFIAGCWSGSCHKEAPEHIFRIWVKVDKQVSVEQKGEN